MLSSWAARTADAQGCLFPAAQEIVETWGRAQRRSGMTDESPCSTPYTRATDTRISAAYESLRRHSRRRQYGQHASFKCWGCKRQVVVQLPRDVACVRAARCVECLGKEVLA